MLFGGNIVNAFMYAFVLDACIIAFGGSINYWTLLALNIFIGTIASLIPIPGGGTAVNSVGMTGALTAVGVSTDIAVAAVLANQLVEQLHPRGPRLVRDQEPDERRLPVTSPARLRREEHMLGQAIGDLLPLALGVAICPIPIIAVILMLFSQRARANSAMFLLGWIVGVLGGTVVVLIIANTQDLTQSNGQPEDSVSTVKLVLGVLLILLAARQWRSRPKEGETPTLPKYLQAIDTLTPPEGARARRAPLGGEPEEPRADRRRRPRRSRRPISPTATRSSRCSCSS